MTGKPELEALYSLKIISCCGCSVNEAVPRYKITGAVRYNGSTRKIHIKSFTLKKDGKAFITLGEQTLAYIKGNDCTRNDVDKYVASIT